MIDLHMHSVFSDGHFTPEELMEKIATIGLKAVALTDHDMVDGCARFKQAALQYGIDAVNGSELSVDYPHISMEIIALDIPEKSIMAFQNRQKVMIEERFRVAKERLYLLEKLGMPLEWQDVAYYENGRLRNQIGKPHIVAAMLKAGYIKDWDEGFAKYLNRGCPAYVVKKEPPFDEVITFVRDNGAVPVLAHPVHTKRKGQELFGLLTELKKYGLMGVEVFHSDHSHELRDEYLQMIENLGLISAGGSDFHGGAHPEVQIGIGKGDLNIPDVIIDVIKKRKASDGYYSELRQYV